MKLDMARFQPEAVEEGMDPSVCTQGTPTQDTDNFFQKLRNGSIVFVAFALFVAVYLFWDTLAVGVNAVGTAFSQSKTEETEAAYQSFYNKGYEEGEKAHHVSNHATISIGNLRETQELEVLAVSEVSYQETKPEENAGFQMPWESDKGLITWLEIPGNGVFTVDLQAGEFIIDPIRQLVLIRIPGPELAHFTLDYESVNILYFEESGILKNTAKCGIDTAKELLQSAEFDLIKSVTNNQDLHKRARKATEVMLTTLVQQLNPHLPELTVEVEFLN